MNLPKWAAWARRRRWWMAGGLALLIVAAVAAVRSRAMLVSYACFSASVASAPVRIPDPADGIVRFIALGDTGTGKAAQREVARRTYRICQERGCDFLALLGDNFYRGGLQAGDTDRFRTLVQEPYARLGIPIVGILGNHDLDGSPAAQVTASLSDPHWRMPDYRYQFDVGPAHFYAVNTNCGALEWLRLAWDLRSTDPGWRFVLAHHAIHSTAQHGDSEFVSEEIWDLMIEEQVDFVLSGHNHVMELLSEPGYRPSYVVAGSSGGAKSKRFAGDKKRKNSEADSHFLSYEPGLVWVEITAGEARVLFFDAKGALLYEHRQFKRQ